MRRKPETAFAKNISVLRDMRGWSQEYVAAKLGVTQKQVSKYESGRDWVSATTLVAYAKLFNVMTDQLLGLKPIIAHSLPGELETNTH